MKMNKDLNDKYRAGIVRPTAQALGRDEDEIHAFFKAKFMSVKYLNDNDFKKYITDCEVWAAEHGVELAQVNSVPTKNKLSSR